MFDIGWSELLVIAVIAIVVVGPKDLPRMLRTFGNYAGKAKRVANDFKRQFNEALREAELEDVRKSVEDLGKMPSLSDLTKPAEPARPADKPPDVKPVGNGATPPAADEPAPAVDAATAAEPAPPAAPAPPEAAAAEQKP